MDSEKNNQVVEDAFGRAQEGSAEDAANKILNMWESPEDEQPTDEEVPTTEDEEVAEDEEEEDEVETEEDSEEEQTEEEVEEAETDEEEVEEEAEEEVPTTFKVTVDGEEIEVDIDELKDGYQRQSDYTRKAQALAEERKKNEAIHDERIRLEQERQMYANGLAMLKQTQEDNLAKFKDINWEQLKEDDQYEYMVKKEEFREAQEKVRNVEEQMRVVQQQQIAQAQRQRVEYVQTEMGKLAEVLPDWNNIKGDVKAYAISQGFEPQEIEMLADHRSIVLLKKAMDFDKLTEKVKPKKKAVKKVPKVQKSGRGKPKAEANNEQVKKKRTRLKKSGNTKDAASVFMDML